MKGWYFYQVIKRETSSYFKKNYLFTSMYKFYFRLLYFFLVLVYSPFLLTILAHPPLTMPATSISLTSGLKSLNGMSKGFLFPFSVPLCAVFAWFWPCDVNVFCCGFSLLLWLWLWCVWRNHPKPPIISSGSPRHLRPLIASFWRRL